MDALRTGAMVAVVIFVGCLVPFVEVLEETDAGGGGQSEIGGAGGAGGAFSPVACGELFPADWPPECAECIEESTCCDSIAAACGASETCVDAAWCLASHLDPAGPGECGEAHEAYLFLVSTALTCADQKCAAKCFGSNWSCADDWSPQSPPDPSDGPFYVTLRLRDWLIASQTVTAPIVGADVRVCERSDTSCASPVAVTTTTALGGAVFEVDLPFKDYFEMDADGYEPPWRIFLPQLDDGTIRDVQPLSTVALTSILDATALSLDPSKAHLFVHVADCLYSGASDVSVTLVSTEPNADLEDPVYFDVATPVIGADSTGGDGEALLINADPANVTVRAHFGDNVVAHANVSLTAGTISYVWLEPARSAR